MFYDLMIAPLDSAGPPPRAIVRDFSPAGGLTWSRDGRRLTYTAGGRVATVPVVSGEMVTTGEEKQSTFDPAPPLWDRDGRTLYAVRAGNSVRRISAADGSVTEVARLPGHTVVTLLSQANRNVAWSPDGGRSIVAVAQDGGTLRSGLFRIELATGRVTPRLVKDQRLGGSSANALVGDMWDLYG